MSFAARRNWCVNYVHKVKLSAFSKLIAYDGKTKWAEAFAAPIPVLKTEVRSE